VRSPLGSVGTVRVLWAGAAVASLLLLDARQGAHLPAAPTPTSVAAPQVLRSTAPGAPCPSGTLADHDVCIPVPATPPADTSNSVRLQLMPGRPEDYARYEVPVHAPAANAAASGGSIFVPAPAGTRVDVITLESQSGTPRRLPAPAGQVLTLQQVTRNGVGRSYLLLYEGLDTGPAQLPSSLVPGSPLGRIVASPGLVSGLRLGVRQLRRNVDPEKLPSEQLLRDSRSVECDPRNVLPLRP
jgi:hypothetical protein